MHTVLKCPPRLSTCIFVNTYNHLILYIKCVLKRDTKPNRSVEIYRDRRSNVSPGRTLPYNIYNIIESTL